MKRSVPCIAALLVVVSSAVHLAVQSTTTQSAALVLWVQGKTAFGVFVPNEGSRQKPLYTKTGGERLAANPLYDFAFLNLEGGYESAAVEAMGSAFRTGGLDRKTLIVRVPAFHSDPAAGRARIREVFGAGADGITFPHVETLAEARQIIAAAREEKIDVWSRANRKGQKILMLMIEDPDALGEAAAFADLDGYSILACGIGSLTQALGGNREAAEAGTQKILTETKRTNLVNMLTATTQDIEKRVKEGFLAVLAQGQDPDAAIKLGRAAAGR
jgi:2-keto-3-deoxy-L-rhamnonate aldolase RhmA